MVRLYEAKQIDGAGRARSSIKGTVEDVLTAFEEMAEEAERLGATSDAAVTLGKIREIEFVYVFGDGAGVAAGAAPHG